MAGIQKYTSSLFVQSGSRAKFESGLEVTESIIVAGTISASGYFDLEGNEITGDKFFAGSGSGVSASNPRSEDTFIQLESGKNFTENIFIHTTHSNTFDPNHYAFVKIEDEFKTKQEGSLSNYNVGQLTPGVYRYLVYGAKTGSLLNPSGETHQVYTTLFIKGFVNEAPVLIVPTASAATMSIGHDESAGSLVLHFTNSFDPNDEDAISFFTASQITPDSIPASSTQAFYKLVMSHSNFSGLPANSITDPVSLLDTLQTSSYDTVTHNGLKPYANTLFFTASISNYSITSSNGTVHHENRFDSASFKVTIKDENETIADNTPGVSGVDEETFKIIILAPPTASISDIKVKFEDGGFTGIDSDTLTHTLLYDKTESLSSASIATLHDRYTSSLIRLSTRANVIPPLGYDPSSTITQIKISTSSNGASTIPTNNNFRIFKFVGANGGSTASAFAISTEPNIAKFNGTYTDTESLGYTSFVFKPNFEGANPPNTQSFAIGARTSTTTLNKTYAIAHGNNHHYQAFRNDSPGTLTIHNIPNIEISDIVVEVESGSYGSNTGYPSLTSSLLYGYTASLLSSQTQSLLIDKIATGSEDPSTHPQYLNYISASVVRLRVKAKITEPFGPDHKPITFTLTGSNEDNSIQLTRAFEFSQTSQDTASSDINYSSEAKPRLIGIYTSSWVEFNFPTGVYNFTTHLASSSNAGSTIDTISTAVVSMSNYNPVLLNDLVYETETHGYSNVATTSTTRQVLYGHNHKILGNSSSYASHISASVYASQSVLRMRVKGKITEPFGPATSKLNFNFFPYDTSVPFKMNNSEDTNVFSINTTSSNNFINNQLVTTFTSSFIGKDINTYEAYHVGPSLESNLHLSGSVNFSEDSTNEFIGVGTLSVETSTPSTLTLIDTPATIIEDIVYETETFGHSEIASTSTTRSVLYGDSHITNETSGSKNWENHENSGSYASSSVTRFRIRAKIIEPLGFLHHSSSFEETISSSGVYETSSIFNFFTGSSDAFDSSSAYDGSTRLVTSYTTSFHGHILSSSIIDGVNYLFTSGNILHNPSGENGFTTSSGISSNILVKDTPQTQFVFTPIETETFGESNVGLQNPIEANASQVSRSIRFGRTTTDITGSGITDYLTGSTVSRFRTKVTITEPLGFLHHPSKIQILFNSGSTFVYGPTQSFSTNSLNIFDSSSNYDSQDRLVTIYTSSFTGSALTATPNHFWKGVINNSSITHEPLGENGDNITTNQNDSLLYFVVTGSDDNPTNIVNITIEVESGSFNTNVGHSNLTSSILYGFTSSLLSSITKSLIDDVVGTDHQFYSDYISQSIVRLRLKAEVNEPFGLPQGTFTATIQTSSETPAGAFDLLPFTPPTFTFSSNTGTPTLENFLGNCTIGTNNITASVTTQLDNVIQDGTLQVGDTFRLKYIYGQQDLTITSIDLAPGGESTFRGLTFNENLTPIISVTTEMYQLLPNNDLTQITSFTSSFVEIRIPSGTYTFTSSFTADNNAIELGPQTTAEISMSSVAPTKFEDFHYEIEKHGYAGSGSNDANMVSSTSRDVLFGDDHFISDGTGSNQKGEYFASHASASIYASHSVARFRVRGKMVEPFGPGTTNSTVNLKITSSNYDDLTFGNVSITPTTAGTYTSDKELITLFTSSLESQSIQLRTEDYGHTSEIDFHVSGNITHNPISLNNFKVTNPSFGTITVKDTKRTEVVVNTEFEKFGYSASNASDSGVTSTIRTVLYGDAHIVNDGTGSGETGESWKNHPSASTYASHSVTRGRVRVEITEPIGPLHSKVQFTKQLNGSWQTLNAFTGSSDFEDSQSFYLPSNKFKVVYTESFNGRVLTLDTNNFGGEEIFIFTGSNETHLNADTENGLVFSSPTSTITVKDTSPAEIIINKIVIGSGSGTGNDTEFDNDDSTPDIIKFIPFNSSSTVGNPDNLLDDLEPHSLTRFQILAKIIEPVGYAHYETDIRYSKQNHNNIATVGDYVTFSTNSLTVSSSSSVYDSSKRLVSEYTSSFIGEDLEASAPNFYQFYVNPSNGNPGTSIHFKDNNTEPDPSIINPDTSKLFFIVSSSDQDPFQIKDIVVEVESASNGKITGFGSNVGYPELTSSLMFGLTSSLLSSQTQSFIVEETTNFPSSIVEAYKSGSLIRFRIKAKTIEPFGGETHTVTASFSALEQDTSTILGETQTFTINGSDFSGLVGRGGVGIDEFTLDLSSFLNGAESLLNTIQIDKIELRGDVDDDNEKILNLTIGDSSQINIKGDVSSPTSNFVDAILGNGNDITYPINAVINNGVVSINFDLDSGINSSPINSLVSEGFDNTWEIQLTFSYALEQDRYPFLSQLQSSDFLFGLSQTNQPTNNTAGTVLSSSGFETTFDDGLPRIVNTYTSSWVEFKIITGSYTFKHSFTSASDTTFNSLVDNQNTQSAKVTMSITPPTQLVNLEYETEKFGHAGSGINDANIVTETTRSVLFGDFGVTNPTSASTVWENHPRSASYASHSVSRFRVKGKIIEPFGPASTTQTITYVSKRTTDGDLTTYDGSNVDVNTFNVGADFISSTEYDDNNRRITRFTQSNFTENVGLTVDNPSKTPSLKTDFIVSGNINYTVNNIGNPFPGENLLNIISPISTSVHVVDTAAPQITVTKIETETFGESNIAIGNNNENTPGIISRSIFDGTTTLSTGSGINNLFTASAVTRFRTLVDIVEPLGYLHEPAEITLNHKPKENNQNTTVVGPLQIFSTNSANIFDSSSNYDSQDRLVVSYTSSFTGSKLGASVGTNNERGHWEATASSIVYNPTNENTTTITTTNSELYYVVSKSFSTVDVPTVTNLKVEVELTESGSGQFGNERTTNVLHGLTGSETNQTTNATYNNNSKNQLVMARVMARIEEPPQEIHNALDIIVGGHSTTKTISFATNSLDTSSSDITPATSLVGLVGVYTSSYFPLLLNADGNTNDDPLSDNSQKLDYTISASLGNLSIQAGVTPVEIPLTELSHSVIHVTGALSSSTLITVNSNSINNKNISSSGFGSYYVYSGNELGQTLIELYPTLNTTEPPLTSIDNLVFPTHLDISYTLAKGNSNNDLSSYSVNPDNGTASIILDVGYPGYPTTIPALTNVDKMTLTTNVTDLEEGAGFDSTTSDIFIIPAKPQIMDGDDWTKSFANHSSLGRGASNLYRATLPLGLGNYKSGEPAGTVVNNIFITSKSDGTGNDYNITLSTPSNYTGDYGDSNRAYGYGDTGSLVVKINDSTVINASLTSNFTPSNNDGDQILTGYNNGGFTNGTASFAQGNLILHKVSPFNGVSQSIFHDGINYPNGYQAWNASLNITSKIQDGYNKVEFEHRIFPGTTHSLNTIEWYYDDGLLNPVIDTTKTFTLSNPFTQSLSGISYFLKNSPFTASLNDVFLNIANKTYRNKDNTFARISEVDSNNGIEITPSIDQSPSFDTDLEFKLNSDSNTNGLTLSNGNSLIPTTTATGSISNILIKGVDSIDNNNGLGELREAKIELAVRNNYASLDNWTLTTHNIPIGRFIDNTSFNSSATDLIEDFVSESRRLPHTLMTENYITNNSNTGSLMTGSFDSNASIVNLKELQQIVGGKLKYPRAINYNSYNNNEGNNITITLPSNNDYNVSFAGPSTNRNYYRAFQFDALNTDLYANSTAHQAAYRDNDNFGFSEGSFKNNSKFTLKLKVSNIHPTTDDSTLFDDTADATQQFLNRERILSCLGLSTLFDNPHIHIPFDPYEGFPAVDSENTPAGNDLESNILNNTSHAMSICVRLPGERNPDGNQSNGSKPGTGWGSLTSINLQSGDSPNPAEDVFFALDTSTGTIDIDNTNQIISIPGVFPSNYRMYHTKGIILVRVDMRVNFNVTIEKIELTPR